MGTVTGRLYSTPTRVLAVVAWTFCVFFAVDLVLAGTAASIWHFLPWLLLVGWTLYLLLWRPRLDLHPGGLTVVNILREYVIPFEALKAFRVIQNVSFDTSSGRIASWGTPGAGKLGPRVGGKDAASRTVISVPVSQERIQNAWNVWERAQEDQGTAGQPAPPGQPTLEVTGGWNRRAVVVSLILLVLAAASVFR